MIFTRKVFCEYNVSEIYNIDIMQSSWKWNKVMEFTIAR